MSLRKCLALALSLLLLLGAMVLPASAAELEIRWLPEGVRFATEIGYHYVPELDWLDVCLDEWGFEPAILDLTTGELVEEFDYIGPFSEGLASVCKDDKYGYIDEAGQVVIPLAWDAVRDFHDGVALTILEEHYAPPYEDYFYLDYYLIDTTGAILVHFGPDYGNVSEFHGGVAQVWDPDTDLVWYINTKGEVVDPPENTSVFDPGHDYPQPDWDMDWQGDKCGLVDGEGNLLLPYEYDYIFYTLEGPDHQPGRYWYVQKGDRFGLMEDPTWQDASPIIPWGTWGATAYPSTQMVEVDGKAVEFQMYALKDKNGNDTNYIKLRDLAAVLNLFDVDWDGKNVLVETGKPYAPNGSENNTPYSGPQHCVGQEGNIVMVNGEGTPLRSFVITDAAGGGHTYFRLRDVGKALGFQVGWTAQRGVFVETDKPYQE